MTVTSLQRGENEAERGKTSEWRKRHYLSQVIKVRMDRHMEVVRDLESDMMEKALYLCGLPPPNW